MPPNAADTQGGKAVLPSPERYHTPKEAARILSDYGFTVSEKRIRELVRLGTLTAHRRDLFPGRFYIAETELLRVFFTREDAA